MTPIQAVLHPSTGSSPRDGRHATAPVAVDYLPNPLSLSSYQIAEEVPGGTAPEISSKDILRLADFALSQQLRVNRFQLVNRRYALLPEPAQSETSEALVAAFADGGSSRLQAVLRRDFPNVFLNGIELYAHPGVRIDIRRGGVLSTNDLERMKKFFSAAVSARAVL